MSVTLEWVEKATTKAEKLDALRCAMQQCAIDMHELSLEMSEGDWAAYNEDAPSEYCEHGLGEDITKLLEDGSF